MNRYLLPTIIFLLFIIEGTVFQVFANSFLSTEVIIVPRFSFILVMMSSIFLGRSMGTVFGMGLGLLYDIIYTHILGVYIFSMALVAYILSFSYRVFQRNLLLLLFTIIVSVICLEYLIYGINTIIGITELSHERFLTERLYPGVILNSAFTIIIIFPMRKLLIYIQSLKQKEEKRNNS